MTDGDAKEPITIKKYANRRLYNTATSSYVTLDDLAAMVKAGDDFTVVDAKSGDDITRSVLTQIIFEEENKGGHTMLPISFLRQLIRFYGDSLQSVVPNYLDHSMRAFAENQERMRSYMQGAMGGMGGMFPFGAWEEIGKQNAAMFERAMEMLTPFGGAGGGSAGGTGGNANGAAEPAKAAADVAQESPEKAALDALQQQLETLRRQVETLSLNKKD
ncbi:MAG: polyhydroxyalkanoate synthesis repressor PhaR [Alphaproteobacteria bacterium]|jgi:polyhydroxyalkanoate synthesis repressor PhaR